MTLINKNIMVWVMVILPFILFSSLASASQPEVMPVNDKEMVAFTNANILDPSLELPITDSTILVSKGKVLKIQPNSTPIPYGVKKVDLKGKWVLPGLIDGHVHLAQSGGAFTRPDIVDARKILSYEDEQDFLFKNREKILSTYIRLGITSIFDLGGPSEYISEYKRLSKIEALPEIYYSGALLSPMDMPSLDVNGPMFSKVTTKAQAKELTKQQISQGTHILKVVWTQETGLSHEQLLEIFKPAISTAKRNGLIVAIHVEKLLGAKWAIKAGADILVHGVLRESIDQDLITMMLSNNVTYMPTLTVYHHYFDFLKNELSFSDIETKNALTSTIKSFDLLNKEKAKADNILQLFNKYLPLVDNSEAEIAMLSEQEQSIIKQLKAVFSERYHLMQELNLNQVVSAGVNVSLGTDAGNIGTLHGSSLYGEIQAWKAAGISNKNIIKAVTLGNALAFNVAESIGSLTSGKNANFVVLDENPYKVLSTLRQPIQVYKHGALVFGGDLK